MDEHDWVVTRVVEGLSGWDPGRFQSRREWRRRQPGHRHPFDWEKFGIAGGLKVLDESGEEGLVALSRFVGENHGFDGECVAEGVWPAGVTG